MAKRRRDDDYGYATTESSSDSAQEQDASQVEAQGVEESVAPTTGGPQVYRVEQESFALHGEVVERGGTVTMRPEEAQRLAASGVQLSWHPDDQVPGGRGQLWIDDGPEPK